MLSLDFLNATPDAVEGLHWVFSIFLWILIFILQATMVFIFSHISKWSNGYAWVASILISILIFWGYFKILRSIGPGIDIIWWVNLILLVSSAVFGLFIVYSLSESKLKYQLQPTVLLLNIPIFFLAFALDFINEYIASIPTTYGAALIGIVAVVIFALDNN